MTAPSTLPRNRHECEGQSGLLVCGRSAKDSLNWLIGKSSSIPSIAAKLGALQLEDPELREMRDNMVPLPDDAW
jgi:hypothetical protein